MHPAVPYSEPLVFEPIYQQRVWGGRSLETHYGRELPDPEAPFGESWEISDRPGDESRVIAGPRELVLFNYFDLVNGHGGTICCACNSPNLQILPRRWLRTR